MTAPETPPAAAVPPTPPTLKSLIVGYTCTNCDTEMRGNRRLCPTCSYTVFSPIWSEDKPEWDDRLAPVVVDSFALLCMRDAARSLRAKGEKRERWGAKPQNTTLRDEARSTAQSMYAAARWIEQAADKIEKGETL